MSARTVTTMSRLAFACASKACAPPPVGTGGSKSSGSAPAVHKPRARPAGGGSASTAEEALQKGVEAVKSLSETDAGHELRIVVKGYGDHLHADINEPLRRFGGRPGRYTETVTKMMDKAFDKASVRLKKPITLYRGAALEGDALTEMMREGAEFVDHGFGSTSIRKSTADNFASVDPDWGSNLTSVRMEITAPKGTRVLAGRQDEGELILPRGTRYRVRQVLGDGAPVVVHLEVVS